MGPDDIHEAFVNAIEEAHIAERLRETKPTEEEITRNN